MYKCIGTGKNINYGEAGETVYINDNYTMVALKRGWITNNIIFLGKYKPYTKYMIECSMKAVKRDIGLLKVKLSFYEKEYKKYKGGLIMPKTTRDICIKCKHNIACKKTVKACHYFQGLDIRKGD